LQPEDKGKKPTSKKSSTLKSSIRKRKAISPPRVETKTSSVKPKRGKRNLNFGKDSEQTKGFPKNNNPLNLPHSDSEEEKEKT